MEFGKVLDENKLEQINWTIPETPTASLKYIQSSVRNNSIHNDKSFTDFKTNFYIGAPAWGHKEWVGKIYPQKTPSTQFLYYYSRYFTTIELNTSHYRIPTPEQTDKWKSQVPEGFIFCPKVFNGISHNRNGLVDISLYKSWLDFMTYLQPYCGPCFLQLPPHFSYDYKALLFKFLQAWPADHQIAIEFRHTSWFERGQILPALAEYLHTKNMGVVILDVAGRRDLMHSTITSDFSMIRCIGNALHSTDYKRVQLWNEQLQTWEDQKLSKVYFFMHEPDDILLPEMMLHLEELTYFKTHFKPQIPQYSKQSLTLESHFKI